MKIERWFKGAPICGYPAKSQARWEEEGGDILTTNCLMTQALHEPGVTKEILVRLAAIIDRHFSSRCLCRTTEVTTRVIHFNNHPETTREDVDKVLRIYTEEMESS